MAVDAPLADSLFVFPAGAQPVFNAADAARGRRSHQYHQTEGTAGFRQDGVQSFVQAVELAPGVLHLTGGSHHSLAIEQDAGIVLVEAPLYEARSRAILDLLAQRFPSKRVTHVIASHFHNDHTGGLRTFVASGARIVVGKAATRFFRRTFKASSTIEPDALSRNPVPAVMLPVEPEGRLTLPDPLRPVTAYAIRTSHAADMLIVHLPEQRILFNSDLYNPGLLPIVGGFQRLLEELYCAIVARDLEIELIAGGHAGTSSLDELRRLATQPH